MATPSGLALFTTTSTRFACGSIFMTGGAPRSMGARGPAAVAPAQPASTLHDVATSAVTMTDFIWEVTGNCILETRRTLTVGWFHNESIVRLEPSACSRAEIVHKHFARVRRA